MATETIKRTAGDAGGGGTHLLRESLQHLLEALGERAVSSVTGKVSSAAGRLTDYAQGGGGGLMKAVTGTEKPVGAVLGAGAKTVVGKVGETVKDVGVSGAKKAVGKVGETVKEALTGGGGGGTQPKVTNIVEQIDVGVPVSVAYNQWTRFTEFPTFMKKVEKVEQVSDEKLAWRAQIFLSHRDWESTIIEQVPDERIVWRSKGAKGYVDGAVTFHEVTPDLTRILVVLEYHPQGLFEKTANIWRAQGRRARLELKHFRRYVMTQTILHPDEVEGWRGEIRDGEVVSEGEDETEDNEEGNGAGEEENGEENGTDKEGNGAGEEEEEAESAPRARSRRG